jgi:methanethiol S-methyltransferase
VDAQPVTVRAVAWAGAVLFVAALAYFLFSYSVTFAEIAPGDVTAGSIALDVALFSAFALHHSIFARDSVRSAVRTIVSPQLERSVYVWVASLMLIGVCYFWRPIPGVVWQVAAPWSWGLIAVQLVGAWLTVRSAAVIDVFDLAGVRQTGDRGRGRPSGRPDIEFKTVGPYGWVRHPIYLGWILVVFAVGSMTMTRLVFAVTSSVYILIAIPLEERTIRSHSPAYDDYMRKVPSKLIPGIY